MADQGFLIISDITGYSKYINQSELEHARDSLTDLLKLLIDRTRLPLRISKLEGDAVFSYARAGSILQGQSLLEMIELTYAAFRKALQLMILNTTCTCNACRNLPNLDLKFFVHYGDFSSQNLGAYTELVGNDVNLVHRISKNRIKDETGLRAYAAYTEGVVQALEMDDLAAGMIQHSEAFPDVGSVRLFVQDLHRVWESRKEEMSLEVRPESALQALEFDFPIPAPLLWDYVTKPEYRSIIFGSDWQDLKERQSGRAAPDSVYYCAHGDRIVKQTILEWRPLESYTTRDAFPFPGVTADSTYKISPQGGGSRLMLLSDKARGPWLYRLLSDVYVQVFMKFGIQKTIQALRERIGQDVRGNALSFDAASPIEREAIQTAAAQGLSAESGAG